MNTIERPGLEPEHDQSIVERAGDEVTSRPEVERITRIGWIAKGVVYTLMGVTAISIARHSYSGDEASPKGVLDTVTEQPAGRLLIGALAIGLALYSLWRLLSVLMIRTNDVEGWLDRIGYLFSATFYGVLTYVAAKSAITGTDPERDNTVERWSRSALEWNFGRWIVMAVGIVTIVVGLYFIVRKAIMRSFVDELAGVTGTTADDGVEWVMVAAGVAGWIGRGIVTVLVGYFVARSAWRFDPEDARGFDGALRRVAATDLGGTLVWVSAVGLIIYGLFCLMTFRRQTLRVQS